MSAPPSFPPASAPGPGPDAGRWPSVGRDADHDHGDLRRGARTGTTAGHPRSRAAARAAALLIALTAAVGVWAVWRVFVTTRTGQLLDEAAFEGANRGRTWLWRVAEPVLEIISVPFIAAVLLAAVLLAVVRRRALLAVQVALVLGGANLTTRLLKLVVLERPDLEVGDRLANALPSGHTTAAASVAAALLLIVPVRWRPSAALIGVGYTVATGISTLVGRWHRPSDAVAAVLVVLAWAALAAALPSGRDVVPGRARRGGAGAVVAFLVLVAAVTGGGAGLALSRTLSRIDVGLGSPTDLLTAYAGGALAVVAVSCAAFALLLLLSRSTDLRSARLT